jgi:hypothetical protein
MEPILRVQGKAVRDLFVVPKKLLRVAFGAAFVATLAFSSHAMAGDDEEDDTTFEEKLIQNLLGVNKPSIDYRERSPLVVPPTTATLPPPESAEKVVADPAWPKDADVQRAKAVKRKDRAPRNREDTGRPLTPDEIAGRGPSSPGGGGVGAPSSRQNERNALGNPLSPSELGGKGNIFSSMFSSSDSKAEVAVYPGEPERSSLTEPPKGYLTPSPNYPYGITPSKAAPKPIDRVLEDRAVGRE